jgi:DNA-binding HxlR family transcriptional regulator
MIFDQKRFYKDFLEAEEGMATNILSDRLKKLEAAGVIESKVYEQLKTRKEYSLTQKGKDLVPVLVEMMVWSAAYDDTLNVPPQFVANVKADREEVYNKVLDKLK